MQHFYKLVFYNLFYVFSNLWKNTVVYIWFERLLTVHLLFGDFAKGKFNKVIPSHFKDMKKNGKSGSCCLQTRMHNLFVCRNNHTYTTIHIHKNNQALTVFAKYNNHAMHNLSVRFSLFKSFIYSCVQLRLILSIHLTWYIFPTNAGCYLIWNVISYP